jgi:hypothetical protein
MKVHENNALGELGSAIGKGLLAGFIVIDGFHHAIYAVTAGLAYYAIDSGSKTERRLNRLTKQLHLKGITNRLKLA